MTPPNRHYTSARRIKKNRVTGVYVTHDARRLRRQRAYREALVRGREVGKDVLWGAGFFIGLWVVVLVIVIGGLLLVG